MRIPVVLSRSVAARDAVSALQQDAGDESVGTSNAVDPSPRVLGSEKV